MEANKILSSSLLDVLFEKRVSARKFKKTEVDVFEIQVRGDIVEEAERRVASRMGSVAAPGASEKIG